MHTLLDLRGNIPSFIHISDGKLHDVHALDMLLPEPGAIYVMDRAYVDFARLHVLHEVGAFFVTRAKSNLMPTGCILRRQTEVLACFAIRPLRWTATSHSDGILRICDASDSRTLRPAKRSYSLPIR